MFLGCTIAASAGSLSLTMIPSYDSKILTVLNAIFDELHVTTIPTGKFDGTIPSDWTFDTTLHALFNGDLYGGNVNFTEALVNSVRIKKRTGKDKRFKTIFEKDIKCNEDFSIELMDYYEPLGSIDYAYVPVISGGESAYITNTVQSDFEHFFLVERDASYPMRLSVKPTETMVYETKNIKPLGRKYPIMVVNGNTGYYSGEIECLFMELDKQEQADAGAANEYRKRIYRMLTNSKPKLLKDYDGNLRLITINADISESERSYLYHQDGGFTHVLSRFSWIETGDAYDVFDLYHNGFIDTSLG